MLKRFLCLFAFVAFSTAALNASDSPKLVVQQQPLPKKGAPSPAAGDIAKDLVQALKYTRAYDISEDAAPPATGYFLVPTVQRIPATANAKEKTIVRLTVFQEPDGQMYGQQDIDITGRSAPYISTAEAQAVFQAQPVLKGQPQIVLMNDGLQSTNPLTANTSFSGPAYVESRLIEDLMQQSLLAVPIADYLAEGTNNTAAVYNSNDDAFRQACTRNSRLIALRYVLAYQETINPFFGTQNADATLDTRLQRCGQDARAIEPFRVTSTAHNIGNSGLLNLQYFRLLNWGLTGARKNKSWTGFLGTTGAIASSLMPATAQYAAAATAVGNTSRSTACATSYYMLENQNRLNEYVARRQRQAAQAMPPAGSGQSPAPTPSPIPIASLTPTRNDVMINETWVPKLTNEGFGKSSVCRKVEDYQRDLTIFPTP